MSNEADFKDVNKKGPGDYLWVLVTIFGGYGLFVCAAAIFCGIELWSIQQSIEAEAARDVIAEVNADPAWKLLIDEKFNDNQNEWDAQPYEYEYVTLNRKIENGLYIWNYQSRKAWYFWDFPYHLHPIKDFVASVEIKHTAGNLGEEFGLILRATYDEYYLFEVTENGDVYFQLYTDDKYDTLLKRTTSAIKVGEPNLITVKVSGNHFTFYVNNQRVGEIDDDHLKKGFVGIVTSTSAEPGSYFQPAPISYQNTGKIQQTYPSQYEVDNFKVWGPVTGQNELGTLTPEKGKIVFVSDQDGNAEIYSINTDGSELKRLTNETAEDHSPKWAADGEKIIFISTRDGNPEIYLMNSDGTEPIRITDNSSDDIDPAWSPDGKSIVFSSNRDGSYEIYSYNFDTEATIRLTENLSEDRYPQWSPKNDVILYQSTQYGSVALYLLNISTKEENRISLRIPPYEYSHPSFSPDGLEVIYTSGSAENLTGLMIYEVDTKQNIEVVAKSMDITKTNHSNLFPTWSPDGKQISFTSDRGGVTNIYIISSDGKSIFQVTDTDANESDLNWIDQ